jgi:dienelactone hydrolase
MPSRLTTGAALLGAALGSLIHASAAQPLHQVYRSGAERIPDARHSDIRHLDRVYSMPEYAHPAAWHERAEWLRAHVRASAGLLPWPEDRPAVTAQVFDRFVGDGFSVEKVYFESRPGLYVTGNLYRPTEGDGPFPAVACPHGHWPHGRLHDDQRGSVPGRCIGMARRGMVAFSYDMMGYVDADQMDHRWSDPRLDLWGISVGGLQTLNGVRVLDFLAALPDVDPSRLAVTGASGGGTQTFLLVAADERPVAAAPVNMVSAHFQGGCICENPPALRLQTFNPEIVAVMAPKPLLLVSCTGDWTANTPEVEGPMVRSIYELLGEPASVRWTQVDAEHNYNRESREDVYEFLGKALLGIDDPGWAEEQPFQVPAEEHLRVFAEGADAPGRPSRDELAARIIDDKARAFDAAYPSTKGDFAGFEATYGLALDHALAVTAPPGADIQSTELGDSPVPGGTARRIVIGRAGAGDAIPAVHLAPEGEASGPPVLLVSDEGKSAFIEGDTPGPLASTLLSFGRHVLTIDPFMVAEAVPAETIDRAEGINYFSTYNKTRAAERVQDVATAVAYLLEATGADSVSVAAAGDAGLWALLAAPYLPVSRLAIDGAMFPLEDEAFVERLNVPLLRQAGDLPTAIALAAPTPLRVWNTRDELAAWASRAYDAAGESGRLEVSTDPPGSDGLAAWLLR